MPQWNNVQRQLVVLALLERSAGRRFTYADLRKSAQVYDTEAPNTEAVADDVAVLRAHGLVEVDTARHRRPQGVHRPSTATGRDAVVWARERATKEVTFHLTWAEHRALAALREAYPPPPSPSPVLAPGRRSTKIVDVLRLLREAEEATSSLTVAGLAGRTGLTEYVVRSRLRDILELCVRPENLLPELDGLLLLDRRVDWESELDSLGDDADTHDAGADANLRLVIADRPAYWLGEANDDSTLIGVGLARFGLFPYSVAETVDRLETIDLHSHAVNDDGQRYFLDEARWKLLEWLKRIAPDKAEHFAR